MTPDRRVRPLSSGPTDLRRAAALLIVAAGAIAFATLHRWAGACDWGQFDTEACFYRQDDSWDAAREATFLHPELVGLAVGYVLFGVAGFLVGRAPRRRAEWWWGLACLVLSCLFAAEIVSSPILDVIDDVVPTPLAAIAVLVGPQLSFAAALFLSTVNADRVRAMWLAVPGVIMSCALVDYYLTMGVTGYVAHDAPPWFGSSTVVGLVLCAMACWTVAARLARVRPRLSEDQLAPAAS